MEEALAHKGSQQDRVTGQERQKAKEQLGFEASFGVTFSEPNSPVRVGLARSMPCRDYAPLTLALVTQIPGYNSPFLSQVSSLYA